MISLFIETAKAIPEWKLLCGAGIIILLVAGISFIFHIKVPEDKRRMEERMHPYQFILLVDFLVMILSLISYIFSK